MLSVARKPVPVILYQHAADSASLRVMRTNVVRGPHVRLMHLRRLDERLAAQLDGLAVGGEHAWSFCEAALEKPSPGVMFAAAVHAIESLAGGRAPTASSGSSRSARRFRQPATDCCRHSDGSRRSVCRASLQICS